MPTPTTYTYSIANDCPNGTVNTEKLHIAIEASTIVTALAGINTSGDEMTINFKDVLSDADKIILDGNITGPCGGLIASTDNSPSLPIVQPVNFTDSEGKPVPVQTDNDGILQFTILKPAATKFNLVTPNWCDKTTWYEKSLEVTENLDDTGDHTTFISHASNQYWIDTKHGKIFNEDILIKNNGNKWVVSVTVDGVTKIENSPGETDGDYTVDYKNGKVTFNTNIGTEHNIIATYWYSPNTAGNSTWTIKPPNKIQLLRVEIQFSKDLVLKDTSVFQAYGYVEVFAPHLMNSPYNLPLHTLIPLGDPIKYKTVADFVSESNGAFPLIPAFGGNDKGGWRNQPQDIITLVWDYVSRTDIHGELGMQLSVSLEDDIPHGGTFATATFYCTQP